MTNLRAYTPCNYLHQVVRLSSRAHYYALVPHTLGCPSQYSGLLSAYSVNIVTARLLCRFHIPYSSVQYFLDLRYPNAVPSGWNGSHCCALPQLQCEKLLKNSQVSKPSTRTPNGKPTPKLTFVPKSLLPELLFVYDALRFVGHD